MNLAQWRQRFVAGIISADSAADFCNHLASTPPSRFAVYRNNYQQALVSVLANCYLCCRTIVGEHCFAQLARDYVEHHPPLGSNLNQYGAQFSEFLRPLMRQHHSLSQLAYLSELAKLEWLVQQSYYAKDSIPCQLWPALAPLPVDTQQSVNLVLRADISLLSSRFPLHTLWSRHQSTVPTGSVIANPSSEYYLMVHRVSDRVKVTAIAPPAYQLLLAVRAKQSLAQISANAEWAAQLFSAIEQGWLVGFHLPKDSHV
ncbi:putative DNA-binding domain-containing protein [Shewanella waksmanii]|uniref:HvfC/BufC family peptide modification chaperone n=1 Tax=Shewanella waksmanii TaxID=213783 RepID=UPI0004AE39B6|nr:putative DNA-binding domain-containing protein [Shewanella waksmanii]